MKPQDDHDRAALIERSEQAVERVKEVLLYVLAPAKRERSRRATTIRGG